ncbi:hypothetical protein PTKIN_Ptkin03bG0111100 [Pterospermum kingtungense]
MAHGLRLTINDYPFANDGLFIWDALKQWLSAYVDHYYPNASVVESDEEPREWWDRNSTQMPNEKPSNREWEFVFERSTSCASPMLPSRMQATKVMAALDGLSNHSPDEEYLGEEMEPSWGEDPIIKAAFEKLNGRLKEIEGIIDERNANSSLKNRSGAGIVPYELSKPFSEPGVTGKGVPYSISI